MSDAENEVVAVGAGAGAGAGAGKAVAAAGGKAGKAGKAPLRDVTGSAAAGAGTGAGAGGSKKKSVEETYTKLTQREHVLVRPDSYIGSTQKQAQPMWVLDRAAGRIINRPITFVPGLYKIFDEILVNAADNKMRDRSMSALRVVIDPASNTLSVWNNGKGIPVVIHKEHKVYVPELIFGHLLTSSNYDDAEKKVTGGRNGYGAKLANIFSLSFTVEAADGTTGKRFVQTFSGNMTAKTEPAITAYSGPDYTCITFKPDLARFGMASLDEDIVDLLSKRVYDMAGVLGKSVAVTLNGVRVPIGSFAEYVALYVTEDGAPAAAGAGAGAPPGTGVRIWERMSDRWEVCLTLSDGTFGQVSFVNSICTYKGGQHVSFIADQIAEAVAEAANKKNKGVDVKPAHVRNYMMLFVNCLVENPSFDSQTKETLTTRPKDFGTTPALTEKFLKQVLASGIVERVQSWARYKATAELQRATGGKKATRFVGIPKLDDANYAGGSKAPDCTLILTEGDSAKSLAIAGMSVVGRDYFGVFPLKGKLLNVREASHKQIMGNVEIQAIVTILGLTYGKVYDSVRGLRYGHLMIMADQDHDGSHIKGLVLNFLHHFWPSLLAVRGFLREFITPIVKAVKGATTHTFFTLPEYIAWKESLTAGKSGKAGASASTTGGYSIKYYKGLGTSTAAEAKDYFTSIDKHQLDFEMDDPAVTGYNAHDLIDLAFSRKRADDRKEWLKAFEPGTHVDYDVDAMLVSDFITRELILFSMADNVRSIPSMVDGLKPAQRKVLFAAFKRNLRTDIKVAQLAGYVSEHSAYHHGEAALAATIIGMAQDYVGSNNVNLLVPSGQFGTRLMGGKDAASPRYIFTRLAPATRAIYHPDDDALLRYLDDDGQSIEPQWYMPVLPLVLVNGADGIGTGWSTSVPTYNPRDVIAALRARIAGLEPPQLTPWFRGFKGRIERRDDSHFTAVGIAEVDAAGEVLTISELPVGRWTADYKAMLVEMITGEKKGDDDGAAGKAGAKGRGKAKAATGVAAVKAKAKAVGKATKVSAAVKVKKPAAKKAAAAAVDEDGDIELAPAPAAAVAAPEEGRTKRAAASKAVAASKAMHDDDDGDDDDGSAYDDDDADFCDDDDDDDDDEDFGGKKGKAKGKGAAAAAKAAPAKKAPAKKKRAADSDDDDDDDDEAAAPAPARAPKPKKDTEPLVTPGVPLVASFAENHTDTTVAFTIKLTAAAGKLVAPAAGGGPDAITPAIRKVFKLDSAIATTNMHLFTAAGAIKRYETPIAIVDEFVSLRLEWYTKRKEHLLARLGDEVDRLGNRARFILAVVKGDLVVSNRKKAELLAELHDAGYKGFDAADAAGEDEAMDAATAAAWMDERSLISKAGRDVPTPVLSRRYGYLLTMPLWSLTLERVTALREELAVKEAELARLRATAPTHMWLTDLDALEAALDAADAEAAAAGSASAGARKAYKPAATRRAAPAKSKAPAKKKARRADSDEDDSDGSARESDWDDDEEEEYGAGKKRKAGGATKAKAAPAAKRAAAAPAAKKTAAAAMAAPVAAAVTAAPSASASSFLAGLGVDLGGLDIDLSALSLSLGPADTHTKAMAGAGTSLTAVSMTGAGAGTASLAERLAARAGGGAVAVAAPVKKAAVKAAKPTAATVVAAAAAAPAAAAGGARPKRTAAAAAPTYAGLDSDGEEDGGRRRGAADSDSDGNFFDVEVDSEEEGGRAKGRGKQAPQVAVKRAKSDERAYGAGAGAGDAIASPVRAPPKAKKARLSESGDEADAAPAKGKAKAPAATKKPAAKKKRAADSDDSDDFDSEEEGAGRKAAGKGKVAAPAAAAPSRPGRAAAAVARSKYVEEEAEESDAEDDDDDEEETEWDEEEDDSDA